MSVIRIGSTLRATLLGSLAAGSLATGDAATPNAFFARGKPTFVVGTLGDEKCDRAVAAQVRLIRELVFHDAPMVDDAQVGREWPANPILYGGAHVNALVKSLATSLPFVVDAGRVEIGGERFVGDEFRLIAFVPADASPEHAHPDFLLYAGAATPGVEEINAVSHGAEGFVVCDRFGPLVRGDWVAGESGTWKAELGPRERRIEWRESSPDAKRVRVRRPKMIAVVDGERGEDAAIERGLARAEKQLGVVLGLPLDVHVYPDRGSKQSLTRNGGEGHADAISCSLHVLAVDASVGGALENLVCHEATHVLAAKRLGSAGSPLLGEGLAVWTSGRYVGKSLAEWKSALPKERPSLEELMGPKFRVLPENVAYPLGGILVETLVQEVGRERMLATLYGATPSEWRDACERAKTTAERVDHAFASALGR